MKPLLLFILFGSLTYLYASAEERIQTTDELGTKKEKEFINDLMVPHRSFRNYILIGMDLNIPCIQVTCEKYSISNFQKVFNRKGALLNKDDNTDIQRNKNAASSGSNVLIIKFSKFTQFVKKFLTMVRDCNMKSYIVVIIDKESIEQLADFILENEMFNIFIVKKGTDSYLMDEICAYCAMNGHTIRYFNSWKYKRGFLQPLRYASSFKGSFFGADLKVGMRFTPLNIFPVPSHDGKPTFAGKDCWILMAIAKYLNFKPVFSVPKDGTACFPTPFGYTGFCKMLLNKEVQLVGFPWLIDYQNYKDFDPTAIYFQVSNCIVSANPPLDTAWGSMLFSVKPLVFGLLMASFVVVTLLLWIIPIVHPGLEQISLNYSTFQSFAVLCLEGTRAKELKCSQQLVLGIWMLACFFVISIIFGEITSIVASPQASRQFINNINDMREFNVSWITETLFPLDGVLMKNLPEMAPKRKYMGIKSALEYVLDHPLEYIYYYPKVVVEALVRQNFWNGLGKNPFHYSTERVTGEIPNYVTILQRKDSPYRDAMTQAMLYIEAADLLRGKYVQATTDILVRGSNITTEDHSEEELKIGFTIDNMIAVFTLLGFVIASATIVFIFEAAPYFILRLYRILKTKLFKKMS